ncbi:response regulator transcription factor [Parendozoicomonas sp. Alg238-R29]|uniref:response regulator transcription factor n=1 Tax=Parendozoicomonas sp. Alg238-R29 TaxID=2993446 RepID=UPI00248EBAA5|nr:response regulator transcription factor [Parendozoicomonas sp. Alg238-R29]
MNNKNILIVEDQQDIANLLSLHLSDMGARVTHIANGNKALSALNNTAWDLIVLDIELPGASGLRICRQLREHDNYIPVILLTSRITETDRILGLDAGADDYISKPFSVLELIARIKALFRRVEAVCPVNIREESQLNFGELSIDHNRHEVSIQGQRVELTAREFSLLKHFAQHPGQVFSRSELLNKVWGYGYEGYEHTVNSHINRLRAKLNNIAGQAEYIVTVWGVGYKLEQPTGRTPTNKSVAPVSLAAKCSPC